MQEIEDARIDIRIGPPRVRHRPVDITPVGSVGSHGAIDIGAVDRKAGDNLLERALQDVARQIGGHAGSAAQHAPASRPSTLSSLAISLTMMRSLHVAHDLVEIVVLAGESHNRLA